MTAPDPPDVAGVGAQAVEAAATALRSWWRDDTDATTEELAERVLATALPHLRAQVLAEVDAALRDDERFAAWAHEHDDDAALYYDTEVAQRYLRDTLAGDGGET